MLLCALTGCGQYGDMFWNSMADTLRGPPNAQQLARTTHFERSGIAFDYPAVLRLREARHAGGNVEWNLEYGSYSASVHATDYEMTAADFVGLLAAMGERLDDSDMPPMTAALCGAAREPATAYVRLLGDPTRIEGYDLPAPSGQSRLLLFQDESVQGHPSTLAVATRERVLASLRCSDPR